jgi:subtilisin
MSANRVFLFLFTIFITSACKKEDSKTSTEEDCFVRTSSSNGTVINNQYIVYFKETTTARSQSTVSIKSNGIQLLQKFGIAPDKYVETFSGQINGCLVAVNSAEAKTLLQDSRVAAVEPDKIIALSTCFKVVEPTLVTWGTKRVGYGDGTGKTAWVVDTGIDFTHPDLNVDVNRSRSFVENVSTAADDNGHGTHVAGIIGAKNNSIGILGVASNASLVAIKVMDKDGEGKLSAVINALNYIGATAKAGDVVNMSLGEEGISEYLDKVVLNLAGRGILFSIAAGNDKKPAMEFSPARVNHANVFTVSAIDSLDNFASFSNFGNEAVDYAAPGVRITSCYLNGKYARLSGTSMAAPHLAGLLLLKGKAFTTNGTAKNDPDGTPDPIAHQ